MAAALALPSRYDQAEVIATIKATVCKGASDAQLRMFLEVCKETGLSPWLKEIYFVAEKSIIMASRDGYLRVANEHPMFDGMRTHVERDEKNVPIKATCSVWRKDRSHAITCEAYYSEYKKSGPVWSQYPSAMISKVAEVLALKRSFAINGVVTEEELSTEPMRKGPQVAAVMAEQIPEPHEEVSYEEIPLPEEERSELEEQLKASIAFADLKSRYLALSALKTYFAILGLHGVTKPEAFTDLAAARKCYRELLADITRRERAV
jgi:phage recombination protein Bet